MKFTQIPTNTFKELQLNAGVLLKDFSPSTATLNNSDIIGATSGGIQFTDTPSFKDYGEDIDNCPKNTLELKQIEDREVKISGTYITVNTDLVKSLIGSADVDSEDNTKIIPRDTLSESDFDDIWWVGDYSDKNDASNGGFIAIHMKNALSTGGFQIQSGDKAKGTFAFEYTAHYSIANQNEVPYEVYLKAGA